MQREPIFEPVLQNLRCWASRASHASHASHAGHDGHASHDPCLRTLPQHLRRVFCVVCMDMNRTRTCAAPSTGRFWALEAHECRPGVDRVSTGCRPGVDRVSTGCRPGVDQIDRTEFLARSSRCCRFGSEAPVQSPYGHIFEQDTPGPKLSKESILSV